MKKTIKIIYWVVTTIFVAILLMDGFGGVTHQQAGVDVLLHLGYPVYLLTIVGLAKLVAAVVIWQNKFKIIKEWAYAGFFISCYGAFMSRVFVGDTGIDLFFPIIFVSIGGISYYVWKKYDHI
jgi:hypothetical protein